MIPSYPKREPCFAHKFVRILHKSCAAQEIGRDACWLLTVIAHTEDAARYVGPVTFWNSQLMETLAFKSPKQLNDARSRAIDAGWLIYDREHDRSAGRYFVLIPVRYAPLSDAPLEAAPFPYTEQKTERKTESFPPAEQKTEQESDRKRNRKVTESGKPSTLSLNPNPSPPNPPSPTEGDSGSSPPPDAAEDWGGVEKALVEEDVNIPGACVRACQANGLTPAQAGAVIRRWREVSGKQGPGALVAMLRELRPGPALEKLLGSGAAAKLERQRREAAESERRRAEEAAELRELDRSAGRLLDALGSEEAEHLARSALDDGTGGGPWFTWVRKCRGKPPHAWPAGIRLRCLRVMTERSEVKRP